jgi:hypothetical protein
MKLGQEADQVLQGAAEPIDRPGHDDIEHAARGILPKLVKGWPPAAIEGPVRIRNNRLELCAVTGSAS